MRNIQKHKSEIDAYVTWSSPSMFSNGGCHPTQETFFLLNLPTLEEDLHQIRH